MKTIVFCLYIFFFISSFEASSQERTGLASMSQGHSLTYRTFMNGGCGASLVRLKGQPLESQVLVVSAGHCLNSRSGMVKYFQDNPLYHEDFTHLFGGAECPIEKHLSECLKSPTVLKTPTRYFDRDFYIDYINNFDKVDILIGHLDINYLDLAKQYGLSAPLIDESDPTPGDSLYYIGFDNRGNLAGSVKYCEFQKKENYILPVPAVNPYYTMNIKNVFLLKNCATEVGESGTAIYGATNSDKVLGIISAKNTKEMTTTVQPIGFLKNCLDRNFRFDPRQEKCGLPLSEK
jgi:hypothetical protein